jgi:phosphatidylglycerophosphate synthase
MPDGHRQVMPQVTLWMSYSAPIAWLVAVVVGRDVVLSLTLPVLRHHGYGPLAVHDLGKAATLCLLYAFPLLLLADNVQGWLQAVAEAFAVAFTGWGVALYLWSGGAIPPSGSAHGARGEAGEPWLTH